MAKERRGIKVNSQLTVSLALIRPYYLVIYHRAESSLSSSLRVSLTTLGYLEVTEVFCALTREEMERPAHSHPPRAHGRGQAGIPLRTVTTFVLSTSDPPGVVEADTAAWCRVDDRRVIRGHCACSGGPDALGRPIVFTLTPGHTADIAVAPVLLDTVNPSAGSGPTKPSCTDTFRISVK
jgi:hypothetical protein